jgi:hypothetical protein
VAKRLQPEIVQRVKTTIDDLLAQEKPISPTEIAAALKQAGGRLPDLTTIEQVWHEVVRVYMREQVGDHLDIDGVNTTTLGEEACRYFNSFGGTPMWPAIPEDFFECAYEVSVWFEQLPEAEQSRYYQF